MSVLVYEACFAGDSAPRAVFLRGFQALMRCIMAVYVAVHKTAEIPQLQFINHGRRHSLRGAEADPHGPDYSAVP